MKFTKFRGYFLLLVINFYLAILNLCFLVPNSSVELGNQQRKPANPPLAVHRGMFTTFSFRRRPPPGSEMSWQLLSFIHLSQSVSLLNQSPTCKTRRSLEFDDFI